MKNTPNISYNNIPKTPGEKSFNLLTYWGIGGVVNAAISLKLFHITHFEWKGLSASQQETHLGKRAHDFMYRGAEKMAKPFEGLLGKSEVLANGKAVGALKHSQRFMLGSILGVGGWFVLTGIRPMEQNKAKVVAKFNEMHGYTPSEEQIAAINNEPKQSWATLLGGRTVAFFTPVLAAMPVMDIYEKWRGKEIFDDMADGLRHSFNGKLRLENAVKNMSRENGRYWSKTFLAEGFYTAIGITVLYATDRFFRGHNKDPYGKIDIPKHPLITGSPDPDHHTPTHKVAGDKTHALLQDAPLLTQEVAR